MVAFASSELCELVCLAFYVLFWALGVGFKTIKPVVVVAGAVVEAVVVAGAVED